MRAAGGAAIAVFDPATEERIGEIAEGTAEDVARAVVAANTAQRSWRKVNHHRRAELLHEGKTQAYYAARLAPMADTAESDLRVTAGS